MPLIIALVAFVAARRSLAGRSSVRYGIGLAPRDLRRVGTDRSCSPRPRCTCRARSGRLLATLVFFRSGGTPLPGLGAGPLLLTLSLTVVVMPLLVGLTRTRPSHGRDRG